MRSKTLMSLKLKIRGEEEIKKEKGRREGQHSQRNRSEITRWSDFRFKNSKIKADVNVASLGRCTTISGGCVTFLKPTSWVYMLESTAQLLSVPTQQNAVSYGPVSSIMCTYVRWGKNGRTAEPGEQNSKFYDRQDSITVQWYFHQCYFHLS